MKSKLVDYVCEPNNYRIQIADSTYGIVTIELLIDEKPTLYRKYRCDDIDYGIGNRLVKQFCDHIQKRKVKLFDEDKMYIYMIKQNLKKVYNRLGLLIWEKNNATL